jgi:hypothetical protein
MMRDREQGAANGRDDGLSFGPPPIFCEQCPDLAMAVVDDSALCVRCTMAALAGRGEAWIAEHASPLPVRAH